MGIAQPRGASVSANADGSAKDGQAGTAPKKESVRMTLESNIKMLGINKYIHKARSIK